jgi:hypothetical protein
MDVLVEFGFKVHRGFEAECAVEPHAVLKDFDPFEDGRVRFGARGELAAVDEFSFLPDSVQVHCSWRVVLALTLTLW